MNKHILSKLIIASLHLYALLLIPHLSVHLFPCVHSGTEQTVVVWDYCLPTFVAHSCRKIMFCSSCKEKLGLVICTGQWNMDGNKFHYPADTRAGM